MVDKMEQTQPSQLDKLEQTARELETDDDPERSRLRKPMKHKAVERPE